MLLENRTMFEARMHDFDNLASTEEERKQSRKFDLALKKIEELIPEENKDLLRFHENILIDAYCSQLAVVQDTCYNYGLDDGLSIIGRAVMASRRNKSKRISNQLRSNRSSQEK